jgi:hypothetical protein
MPRPSSLVPVLLALAVPAVASAANAEPACVLPPVGKVPFATGETLEFALESLGAQVGTVTVRVRPGKRPDAWTLEARGRTGSFASNFVEAEATAKSSVGRGLASHLFQQTSVENGVQRTLDVTLPPKGGVLKVRATKDGVREDYGLPTPDGARDLLAALYALRSVPLKAGQSLCVPLFDGRRVWTTRLTVVKPEVTTTHAGDFKAFRLEGTTVRLDRPSVKRELQIWVTDDAQRLPVAACTDVQDKPVCLNLRSAGGARGRVASAEMR